MIEFRDVTKQFRPLHPGEIPAVDRFSHIVNSRQLHVLLGSSGCGKTTLLRMVNRMETPTRGFVLIDGEDVAGRNPVELRRSIGYVMQASGLLPHRTVLDNVTTVLRLQGQNKGQVRERGLEMLDLVGLTHDLAGRYPAQLSGGQAQRVGVARALAPNPRIVLMDEPFAAVDPLVRRQLQDLVKKLQAELQTTILFVTHDVDEALRIADHIVLLREGAHIEQTGSPGELLAHPASQFVDDFLGLQHTRKLSLAPGGVVTDDVGRPLGSLAQTPSREETPS